MELIVIPKVVYNNAEKVKDVLLAFHPLKEIVTLPLALAIDRTIDLWYFAYSANTYARVVFGD
jgi:hypothetical protein